MRYDYDLASGTGEGGGALEATRHRPRVPAIGASGTVLAYGHWGRPVLVFPSEAGEAGDFESNGMIDAVADLLDGGRVKLYCVDSYDAQSWSDRGIPLEERARRHGSYKSWIIDDVASWIFEDCGGPTGLLATGCSMGAFHAANFALKRADVFPQALCLSGNYTREAGTAGASAARRSTSTPRSSTSPGCTASTWTGCAGRCT